jgi:hypothetical protein
MAFSKIMPFNGQYSAKNVNQFLLCEINSGYTNKLKMLRFAPTNKLEQSRFVFGGLNMSETALRTSLHQLDSFREVRVEQVRLISLDLKKLLVTHANKILQRYDNSNASRY